MQDKYEILSRCFGYASFRSGQAELIDAQLAGRDAFGIMPTGGGKSLCYQVPALLLPGITLVVSPLISLMMDQVTALRAAGIPAAYLNSTLNAAQFRLALKNMQRGCYKILYVAPERLLKEDFLEALAGVKLSLLAVDEAHCISQWGQDFRPSYLQIVEFLRLLPVRPVVSAFTATATPAVAQDVQRILALHDPLRVTTGFDRPNLSFQVMRPGRRSAVLERLVAERAEHSGIVYCATRREVENVCLRLQQCGHPATRYHAGLPDEERLKNQDDFIYDRCRVMVATNAFGMGIDKSNVSYVIHYNMPQSMEAYYQEAGRAGRDGTQAECILLFSPADIYTARFLIEKPVENDPLSPQERKTVMAQDKRRLEAMIGYCQTERCLRGYILDYFGQSHPEVCGNCSNCTGITHLQDITSSAQMILSCVYRARKHLGYAIGAELLAQMLRGSQSRRVMELGLAALPTWGLMKEQTHDEVRELIDALVSHGYLRRDPTNGSLLPTAQAAPVLFQGQKVEIPVRRQEPPVLRAPSRAQTQSLLETLKALRLKLSLREKVPSYVIFSNATLQDMASKAPASMEELLRVSGVGRYKAERYGALFLDAIRTHTQRSAP